MKNEKFVMKPATDHRPPAAYLGVRFAFRRNLTTSSTPVFIRIRSFAAIPPPVYMGSCFDSPAAGDSQHISYFLFLISLYSPIFVMMPSTVTPGWVR